MAEQIIFMFVNVIVATGLTQWVKRQAGIAGLGALALAVLVSFVMALVAWVISQVLAGDFSLDQVPGAALQIFALATIAYKALLAHKPKVQE